MTKKTDMPGFILQSRMLIMIHGSIISWSCNITINNYCSVKCDLYLCSFNIYLLIIPFANRFLKSRLAGITP